MRLSSNENDRGYASWLALGGKRREVKIILDGVLQDEVLTADDEEGTIVRSLFDADGRIVVEGDEVATETLSGRVEIILPDA